MSRRRVGCSFLFLLLAAFWAVGVVTVLLVRGVP